MLERRGLPHLIDCVTDDSRYVLVPGTEKSFKPLCNYCNTGNALEVDDTN